MNGYCKLQSAQVRCSEHAHFEYTLSNIYTMVCPPVRWDNQTSALSPIKADTPWNNYFIPPSIGVGMFRIFGGPRFRILGGGGAKGGGNSQQAHDVVTTSMRRNDVASTSFRRHVPTRFLINQCQIITFLILKYDIENSRIELRGIVLPVQVGGLMGGGPKGMLAPPPKLLGGGLAPLAPPPPPLPTPMPSLV